MRLFVGKTCAMLLAPRRWSLPWKTYARALKSWLSAEVTCAALAISERDLRNHSDATWIA